MTRTGAIQLLGVCLSVVVLIAMVVPASAGVDREAFAVDGGTDASWNDAPGAGVHSPSVVGSPSSSMAPADVGHVAGTSTDIAVRSTATAADFGFGSMRVDGKSARGVRPVIVVLVNYDDTTFRPHHTREFYVRTMANVSHYATENSQGRFTWGSPTILGPYTLSDDPDTDWDEGRFDCWWNASADCDGRPTEFRDSIFLRTALRLADDDIDYGTYDLDGDGELTSGEVAVVVIGAAASPADGGSTRGTCVPNQFRLDDVTMCLSATGAGEGVGFGTLTHEMAHQLGTVDVYGSACRSVTVTLMSCTIFGREDDRASFHLDPWHKIQLGWVEPRIYSTRDLWTRGQCLTLEMLAREGSYSSRDDRRPILLYDPARYDTTTRTGEFYLLEARQPVSFDGGLPDTGMAVWYVQMTDGKLTKIVAKIKPNGPSDDDTGALDSRRSGDDVLSNGEILPGPNGLIDTVLPTGDDGEPLDAAPTDALNFVVSPGQDRQGAPRNASVRGGSDLWWTGDGEVELSWFDGSRVGIPLHVVGRDNDGDVVVALNARALRIDAVPDAAAPGSRIRLDGLFAGRSIDFRQYKQLRIAGGPVDTLRVSRWECSALVATVPLDLPTGVYQLWVEDPATGASSNRVDLVVRTVVDPGDWNGTYLGSLDGHRARLTIDANVEFDYAVTLTNLDSGVTYTGTLALTDSHVVDGLTLRSPGGETVELTLFVLHRTARDHIAGESRIGGSSGLAFSREGAWVEADGAALDRSTPERWTGQWTGTYDGYLDGRPARLTISDGERVTFGTLRPGNGYQFEIVVRDNDRGLTYRGVGLVDTTSGTGAVHVMEVGRLTAANDSLRGVEFRLHTRDTAHISGWALSGESDLGYGPRAELVGFHFIAGGIDPRLVPALEGLTAGDVPPWVRPIINNERVNLHVGETVLGVAIGESGVPTTIQTGGFARPTLHVYTSDETVAGILDAENQGAAAREAYLAGEIRIESPSLLGTLKFGLVRVAVIVYDFVSGFGPLSTGAFFGLKHRYGE